jgi:hypothetical protein
MSRAKPLSKNWQKQGTVRVRVRERTSIWRHGRVWSGGEVLMVGRSDASKLVGRGFAEEVKG